MRPNTKYTSPWHKMAFLEPDPFLHRTSAKSQKSYNLSYKSETMSQKFFWVLLALCPLLIRGQDTISDEKILYMMNLMGANQNFMAVLDQMATQYMEGETDPEQHEFWTAFLEECRTTGVQEIMTELIPIYRKHLNEEEVDALIAFYGSPAGQTLRDKLPLITVEASKVGEAWGMNTAMRILNNLEDQDERLFNIELEGCDAMREGQFTETLADGTITYIDRQGNRQTETYPDQKKTYTIEWVGPCRYILEEAKAKKGDLQPKWAVNIYEVNADSYKYISRMEDDEIYVKGEVRKEE